MDNVTKVVNYDAKHRVHTHRTVERAGLGTGHAVSSRTMADERTLHDLVQLLKEAGQKVPTTDEAGAARKRPMPGPRKQREKDCNTRLFRSRRSDT